MSQKSQPYKVRIVLDYGKNAFEPKLLGSPGILRIFTHGVSLLVF